MKKLISLVAIILLSTTTAFGAVMSNVERLDPNCEFGKHPVSSRFQAQDIPEIEELIAQAQLDVQNNIGGKDAGNANR